MKLIELRIAFRFLVSRKRAMLMSLGGIACGVAFYVLTQAQTTGFERFYIATILGTSGAIQVHDPFQDTLRTMEAAPEGEPTGFRIAHRESRRYVEGIPEPAATAAAIREFSNVAAVSEVVEGPGRLHTPARSDSIHLYGIRLDDYVGVTDLETRMVFGSLETFRRNPQGALLGAVLARRMQLGVGDSFEIETAGQTLRYRVAGIYETGVRDIDRTRVYLHIDEVRSLLERPFGASFLQVNLYDPGRARADALRMEEVLGHFAYSWQERERAWLEVFRALRVSSGITVATIILISGLGMYNTLAMIVMEKTREIAILRSMGYERRDVSRIFLWQGGMVLMFGTLGGWALGALLTYAVSNIPIRIRGIFATDYFIVNWAFSHYLWAAGIAAAVVLVASLLPARRAARMEPADTIRHSAA